MNALLHVQSLIVDTPLAVQRSKFDAIIGAIGNRIGLDISAEQIEAAANSKLVDVKKQYQVTSEGIAVIPVTGTCLKKAAGMMALSGLASYEAIKAQVGDAFANPNVRGVLLDIDSPGGSTNGLFELGDFIYSLRGDKPIYAIANDAAFSAAYAIASCADKIYVTRTGGVGSIGVFSCHVDQSGMDAKDGLNYTYISAGAKKVDGNPHEALSETAKNDSQAEVDREYRMFTSLVARNRGIKEQDVIDTEAGVYFGETAVPLLADEVGTFEDALAAITNKVDNKSIGVSTDINSHAQAHMKNKLNIEATGAEEVLKSAKKADDEMMEKECDGEAKKATKSEPEDSDDDDDEDTEDDKKASSYLRILNLCTLAGKSELAAGFIGKGFSVEQVTTQLLEARATKSKETKIANATANIGPAINTLKVDPNDLKGDKKSVAYARFLKTNSATYDKYLAERGN